MQSRNFTLFSYLDLGRIINTQTRPPENFLSFNKQKNLNLTSQVKKMTKSIFSSFLFSLIVWMNILLNQSTANSLFLETCSSSGINQVFCHNDLLYVIRDKVLYYGNSCGQMMTNETIRVTKKFRTPVLMNTAFIDELNYIYLFSDNVVLTSNLDRRYNAVLHNTSHLFLDYKEGTKYVVFEPESRHVYIVDKENKMHIFNGRIYSHSGMIAWGKDQNQYQSIELKDLPFEYFFFVGPDLYYKKKNFDEFFFIKNMSSCLKDFKINNNQPDFQSCFSNNFVRTKRVPLTILVCTEIQYLVATSSFFLVLLILLFCCICCCYKRINDNQLGETYNVKKKEEVFIQKLVNKYPKERLNHFLQLYKNNQAPAKLNTKDKIIKTPFQIQIEPKSFHSEPTEIKHVPVISTNYNNNVLFPTSEDYPKFEENSLISSLRLEDYAENKPVIDLNEPKPYQTNKIPIKPPRPAKPARPNFNKPF